MGRCVTNLLQSVILVAMSLILSVSCNSAEEQPPYLSIAVAGIDLSASAINFVKDSTVRVDVSSNAQWRVLCNADWLELNPQQGSGNDAFEVEVGAAKQSRSAVVTVSLINSPQVRHSFDVVQRVSLPNEEPNPNPGVNPTPDGPAPENPGTGTPDPENPSTDNTDPDNPDTDDPNPDNPDPGNPDPTDPAPDEDDDPSDSAEEEGDFTLVGELSYLKAGRYHIGGYQDEQLHLATGGLTSVNHCNTAVFDLTDDGTLVTIDKTPAEVILEAADVDNGYYIRFAEDGYLTARAAGAGKLLFSKERSEYWLFSAHEQGGFVLRQSGDVDVKLIISQNAQSNVLRSIAGDEDANAVFLLRINNPN